MSKIQEIMSKHVIVDVNEHIHVVDGKVIDYEPDTIDFEDENQVSDFFDMVSKVFVHELLPERYGKGNTCVVITGTKSDRTKSISTQGMHHFPPELKEKVQQAILEYENQLKNERIHDIMSKHVIIDIDDYVHVIDGKVICYEPDTIDFEDEEQVKNLFGIATNLYKNGFYTEEYGHGNTRFVISGSKEYVEKYGNIDSMTHFPSELKEKVQQAILEYENQLKKEHIRDMMKQHVIVDIDEHIHVVDGKVIYYEPDTIDFEDEEQVENFFGMVEDLFVHELYPERYGHGNTMLVITGDKNCADKYLSMNGMHHFPSELKEKVKVAINGYRDRKGNNV